MTSVAARPGLQEDLDGAGLAIARSVHAGSTVWVVGSEPDAPLSPLPTGADPVAAARDAVAPGDVVVVVAAADDAVAVELAARAPAWGARLTWLGSGPLPPSGAADDVLWSEDPAGTLADLLERTHDRLQRPDLLVVEPEVCIPVDGHCVTCSDEGRLGEVVEPPTEPFGPARVRTATGEEAVDVTLVGAVHPGDLLLIHAGSALTTVPVPVSGGTP